MVTNHEITVEGDSARHSCLVHAQHVRHDAPGGPHFVIGGRYEDRLVRTTQGWKFEHRSLVITWTEGNPRVLRPADGQTDPTEPPEQTTATEWARRDAAAVWHGFTQMATYEDSTPVIVERGEGNYLYDTDGRRYLDAISSLWVTTLGHADGDLNRAAREQLDRISHSTLLGNGNTAGHHPGRGPNRSGAGDRSPFPVRVGRRGRGVSRPSRSPSSTGTTWVSPTGPPTWLSVRPTTATRSGRCRWETAASAPTCSTRCGSR